MQKNTTADTPKSPSFSARLACIPTPDATMFNLFSAKTNDVKRLTVRLRRLGTVGIFPFQ